MSIRTRKKTDLSDFEHVERGCRCQTGRRSECCDKLIDELDRQMGPTGPERGNIQSAAVVWRKTCSRYQTSWRPWEGDSDVNNLWRSAEHYL